MRLGIIFDTETNGKIISWRLPLTPLTLKNDRDAVLANYPRIAQIAWQVVNLDTGELIRGHEFMIKPDGWTIPTVEELEARNERDPLFFVRNNMSTERCEEFGTPITEVLELMIQDINVAMILVAHNAAFDIPVLKCEMIRYGLKANNKPVEVCTMKLSTDYCKLPNIKGSGFKYPQLGELYRLLFGRDMEDAHDAQADTTACRECFFKLIELRVIMLNF